MLESPLRGPSIKIDNQNLHHVANVEPQAASSPSSFGPWPSHRADPYITPSSVFLCHYTFDGWRSQIISKIARNREKDR